MDKPFVSYAQNFEDVILWRALKNIEHGCYVDVGAYDPIDDSVTMAFYERGWTGINIEPSKSFYKKLCDARSNDINLNCAVSDTEGEIIFYEVKEARLSTLDKQIAEKHFFDGYAIHEVNVSVTTLNSILTKHQNGPIHFLKIDVEGSEFSVINGVDLLHWRPWIIIIEATIPGSPQLSSNLWERNIKSANYEFVYFDGLNNFYLANEHLELREALAIPPNVFDDFIQYKYGTVSNNNRTIETDKTALLKEIKEKDEKIGRLIVNNINLQNQLRITNLTIQKIKNSFLYRLFNKIGIISLYKRMIEK